MAQTTVAVSSQSLKEVRHLLEYHLQGISLSGKRKLLRFILSFISKKNERLTWRHIELLLQNRDALANKEVLALVRYVVKLESKHRRQCAKWVLSLPQGSLFEAALNEMVTYFPAKDLAGILIDLRLSEDIRVRLIDALSRRRGRAYHASRVIAAHYDVALNRSIVYNSSVVDAMCVVVTRKELNALIDIVLSVYCVRASKLLRIYARSGGPSQQFLKVSNATFAVIEEVYATAVYRALRKDVRKYGTLSGIKIRARRILSSYPKIKFTKEQTAYIKQISKA